MRVAVITEEKNWCKEWSITKTTGNIKQKTDVHHVITQSSFFVSSPVCISLHNYYLLFLTNFVNLSSINRLFRWRVVRWKSMQGNISTISWKTKCLYFIRLAHNELYGLMVPLYRMVCARLCVLGLSDSDPRSRSHGFPSCGLRCIIRHAPNWFLLWQPAGDPQALRLAAYLR